MDFQVLQSCEGVRKILRIPNVNNLGKSVFSPFGIP